VVFFTRTAKHIQKGLARVVVEQQSAATRVKRAAIRSQGLSDHIPSRSLTASPPRSRVSNKAYMAARRSSVMSLYEVSDIVRDARFR
jgi:hypothetical protein